MKKLLLVIFLVRIFFSFGHSHPDVGNHLDWGIKFWQIGPKNFYENTVWTVGWANQPPGTIYLFAIFRKIYELIFSLIWWLNVKISIFPSFLVPFLKDKFYVVLVKLPAILADFGIAFLIYKFAQQLKNKKAGKIGALIFLLNPFSWYISSVWGQTDSIVNFLGLWSIYLFWRKQPLIAVFIYFLSLYFKGSLIIFLPIILILLIKSKEIWWKKILVFLGSPVFFAYSSLPFVKKFNPIFWLYFLYRDRIFRGQGNMLTANAFNLWALIFGIDFSRNDFGLFLGLSFKVWGLLLFGLCCVPILIFLILKKLNINLVFWSLAIISFSSFVFLTNMHERYLYPTLPYLTILTVLGKLSWGYILAISTVYFLNLYHLWYFPDTFIKNVFEKQELFLTRFFSLLIIFIFLKLVFIALREIVREK